VTVSRRALAAARRGLREEPESVVELACALACDEDGPAPLSAEQVTRLGWWWQVVGVVDA